MLYLMTASIVGRPAIDAAEDGLTAGTPSHGQAVGVRPTIELEPTDHPLAIEQRTGITLAHVQAIAEQLLHPGPHKG